MTYPEFIAALSQKSFKCLLMSFNLLHSALTGFWLGVMGNRSLDAADDYYYFKEKKYKDKNYNSSGLFFWEKTFIESYFKNANKILLIAAGGGRETIALLKSGYDVEAFECNQKLILSGNALLDEMGFSNRIQFLPRNHVPNYSNNKFDGVIIGWGAFSLIRSREERKVFLEKLKPFLKKNAPLMVSFLTGKGHSKQDKVIVWVGNFFRFFSRRQKIEPGDRLVSNFVHVFTRDKIQREFLESGFEIIDYLDKDYGCLIAILDSRFKPGSD